MPNGLNNWTFNDVIRFLKDKGFQHSYTRGSHYYYIGSKEGQVRQITIPFHGAKSIHPRTLRSIITQSGISKDEWLSN